jgi:hypothetical protein
VILRDLDRSGIRIISKDLEESVKPPMQRAFIDGPWA